MRFVFLLALFAAQLIAAPNEQKEIRELYRRGLAGDKEAVNQCINQLEAALQRDGSDNVARVYLGSAYALRSRDLGIGPKKLQALHHGLDLMDQAVRNAPNDYKVRLARALTTSALPGFFGRGGESRKDFEILAQAAERAPSEFDASDLPLIFYNAGLAAKANGDRARAAVLFREGLQHEPNAELAAKLNAELSKLQ